MIAVLSDIHANFPALRAVLQDASSQGCTRVVSLGDVAGYLAQPGECIDLLAQHEAINILGNHDFYLIGDQNCPRSRTVARIIDYQKKNVTPKQVAWLRNSLPSLKEDRTLFLHGGPNNEMDQYLYTIKDDTLPVGFDRLFSGHTHVQTLIELVDERIYCNPGSVGQPRDGDCRAAYATFDGLHIGLRRVEYDIDETAHAMKCAGFESFLYENLYRGTQIGGRVDHVRYIKSADHHESH